MTEVAKLALGILDRPMGVEQEASRFWLKIAGAAVPFRTFDDELRLTIRSSILEVLG